MEFNTIQILRIITLGKNTKQNKYDLTLLLIYTTPFPTLKKKNQ